MVGHRLLEAAGVVRERTGKQRYGVFSYDRYLAILNAGATTPGSP